MLSRIADSLFWLHRYMERADGMLRLLKTSYILSFDKVQASGITWEPALQIFTTLSPDEITILKKNDTAVLQYMLTDATNLNSLRVIVTRARENARGVQDQITKEVWEQVNHLYHFINHPALAEKLSGPDAIVVIDMLINSSDQFCGITDSTMPRGQGWNYMNLGKFTERCLLTVEFTNVFFRKVNYDFSNEQDILFWRSLLLALSGYELHLKNYSNLHHNSNVAQQVLFDKNFPRSLYYTLERVRRYLSEVTESNPVEGTPPLNRIFGRLHSYVKFADLALVAEIGLEPYLKEVRKELNEFSKLLGQTYFSYA
jgi:uncharacterized alpha-E superfamily protein